METIKVQWHNLKGLWLVTTASGTTLPFEQWAETLLDLTQVRMILAAPNYATHWVSLVVSQRHVARVLPFALEEALIEDLGHYLILPAGSVNKQFRAYVAANDLVERLLEVCDLHHVRVAELVPETWLLGKANVCIRQDNGWLFNLPGKFEGFVADNALTPVLESLFAEDTQLENLLLKADSLDAIQLLKTVLETSFPGQVGEIATEIVSTTNTFDIPNKSVNFLTGRFKPHTPKENKPAAWWKPLAGLAAAWLILWTVGLYNEAHTLKTQATEVRAQSLALYKQLFPGERIRMLERQFQEKLSDGGSSSNDEGFLGNTFKLAQVYAQQPSDKVELLSIRYNERMRETTVEVKATSLSELQNLRQTLENAGVNAEIASATNDKDGVKGRLRIAG